MGISLSQFLCPLGLLEDQRVLTGRESTSSKAALSSRSRQQAGSQPGVDQLKRGLVSQRARLNLTVEEKGMFQGWEPQKLGFTQKYLRVCFSGLLTPRSTSLTSQTNLNLAAAPLAPNWMALW